MKMRQPAFSTRARESPAARLPRPMVPDRHPVAQGIHEGPRMVAQQEAVRRTEAAA